MESVSPDDLAVWIIERCATTDRYLFGITGPPGSGKSTLAQQLGAALDAPVVAMDGFHLSNAELIERGSLGIKGAPATFAASSFVDLVRELRQPSAIVECPTFDRTIDEPVANQIRVTPDDVVVIVEGNYLLLDEAPWGELADLLDATAYMDVPDDVRIERLVDRHVAFGRDRPEALEFVRRSDELNARRIEPGRTRAEVLVSSAEAPSPNLRPVATEGPTLTLAPMNTSRGSNMDRWITDWPIGDRFRHFTRANAGEVIATPASPLGQEYSWDHAMILGWRDGYVRQGSYDAAEFDPEYPEASAFFGGYFYINLSNVRLQGARSPILTVEQLDMAFFGDHPDVPAYVAHPLDDRPDLEPGIMANLGWVMSTTEWPELDEEKAAVAELRANRPDLTTLSDAELVARSREIQPLLRKLFDSHTVTSASSGVAPGILFAVGEAIGDSSVPMKLVSGIGEVDSAEPSYAMWDLSRMIRSSDELTAIFDAGVPGVVGRLHASDSTDASEFTAAFDRFLYEHGSRGPNEWELSAEVWETKPTLALSMIDRVRMQIDDESPKKRNAAKVAEREAVTAEVREKVNALDPELAAQFEGAMVASNMLAFRERTKTTNIRAVQEARATFRELAARHVASGDLRALRHFFMLRDHEVEQFIADPASFTDTLAERYEQWETLWDLEPPFFIIDGNVPPISEWPHRGDAPVSVCGIGESIQGVPGCAGVVRGRARVILDPSDPGMMEAGDILIAPSTDPAWTPLFMPASAVVVNVGGQISHSIIVCRELGLPCVVSATDATKRIPDGATIEVDGSAGTVTVIELPA